ncbi:transketolase family protein [Ruminococcaceae bacterium OttesenSCG-928-L11]|nr:transketolase family protein [Ruminococcaceae bacterium OttesenSCG-928-L11]
MADTSNRQVICEVLMERAASDRDLVVLCSDSRGSASLAPFAEAYPKQFVEVGIAEQSLVSVAAGLAKCGKRPFAASPACFLSTRSLEQAKVGVAYSAANAKLIGISGGISYGALGMTHHSAQDIAAMASLPGMRVYIPSDRFQTRRLMEELATDDTPAYIRVGRNPSRDVYDENTPFAMDRATWLREGKDVTLIACGEMVKPATEAAALLQAAGIDAGVVDMYCIKPLDEEAVKKAAESRFIVTVEEHGPFGGLGSMVSQIVARHCPVPVLNLSLPDAPVIAGTAPEVFAYYGLDGSGIAESAQAFRKERGLV